MAETIKKPAKKNGKSGSRIYQLKVTLTGVRPPIWRRIQVESNITLLDLHYIIQKVMGWEGYHLHAFRVGEETYSEPNPEMGFLSEHRAVLSKLLRAEMQKIRYEYDFGDDWQHDIVLEKKLPMEPDSQYPRCLTGKRACPPEDCGGIYGYMGLLDTIADPDAEDHAEMLEWVGEDFNPAYFDVDEVNQVLQGTAKTENSSG